MAKKEKQAPKKLQFLVLVLWVIIIFSFCSPKSDSKKDSSKATSKTEEISTDSDITSSETSKDEDNNTTDDTEEENTTDSWELKHGELVSLYSNPDTGTVVIKAKISPSGTNNLTIKQNYLNMEDYVRTGGGDAYNEIQYWAVADMTNGEESKVISFTMDKDLIDKVADGTISATSFGDYVKDLYILPSLLK
ncbi:MAG: hypothetical protein GX299_07755 [Epulopiscium sp.]|nr:hypothetical protein [Candidatus Epulonipiscium sp.]